IVPVVDAPEIIGQSFAQMAENDLQARMLVEQAAADQPQSVDRGFGRKGPGRSDEPGVAFVERRAHRERPRMPIEGTVVPLDRAPIRRIWRAVVVPHHRRIAGLRIAVDERAFESELFDAVLKLLRRDLRLLHRQGGYADKPVGTLCDLRREDIIGAAGGLPRPLPGGGTPEWRRLGRTQT